MSVEVPHRSLAARIPAAVQVGMLYSMESLTRALLISLIPLTGYRLLGSVRDLSLLYLVVGVASLTLSQLVPTAVRRFGRRRVYRAAVVLLALSPLVFIFDTLATQTVAMTMRVLAVAALNVALSLYILDSIPPRELVRSEPLRIFCSAGCWIVGPTLGVALATRFGPPVAYAATSACALGLLALFSSLPLAASAPGAPPPRSGVSILVNVQRFVAQPRLRLAWLIVFTRSSWWSLFFNYAPLLLVRAGYADEVGAMVVSAGNLALLVTPLYGRLAARVGVRRVIIGAFLAVGAATTVAGATAAAGAAPIAAGLLVAAAAGAAALDALGAIPFLRMVRPRERAEMTAVHGTYRDLSELVPPAIYALLLSVLPFASLFVACGGVTLYLAALSRRLPRRL